MRNIINDSFRLNDRITLEEIEDLKRRLEIVPDEYIQLLKISNGLINEEGIKIYSSNEIEERNQTFEITKYLPSFIAIGDDSGDAIFLMEKKCLVEKYFIVIWKTYKKTIFIM